MNNTEVEVGGAIYRIGRLDAFTQFHVARRIAPIMTAMGLSITEFAESMPASGEQTTSMPEEAMLRVMTAAGDVVARMSDDDANYVLLACLAACRRKDGERWAPVVTGKNLQYQDIRMDAMLRITIEVLKENMGDFFAGLPGAKP